MTFAAWALRADEERMVRFVPRPPPVQPDPFLTAERHKRGDEAPIAAHRRRRQRARARLRPRTLAAGSRPRGPSGHAVDHDDRFEAGPATLLHRDRVQLGTKAGESSTR